MIQSGGRSTGSRPQTPRERRSEERRVGEEGRFRGAPYHLKKKKDPIGRARKILLVEAPSWEGRELCFQKDYRVQDKNGELTAQNEPPACVTRTSNDMYTECTA